MEKKDIIKTIIRNFHTSPLPAFSPREITIPFDIGKVITLIGARRSGKTYILYQLIDTLLDTVEKERIVYINFEDERLGLKTDELDLIIQGYQELYPNNDLRECYFFFDEIQNIDIWEKFVRRVHETITKRVVITGSNAKMLGSEISTTLRGRSISFEVYPLSFKEYLAFKNIDIDLYSSKSRAIINNEFSNYLKKGGFPEIIDIDDEKIYHKILQEYFNVMIFRDLIERYEIKNIPALKYFIKRVFACATKQLSINNIYNELKSAGFKIGKNSLYQFLEEIQAIFLVQVVKKFSYKITTQELGEKKVYVIDNGLIDAVIFNFSENLGQLLEQLIFWELKRDSLEVYYYRNAYECDFLIFDGFNVKEAIQVCVSLKDDKTRKRELKGLVETCKKFNLNKGKIISLDDDGYFEADGVKVEVVNIIKFLVEK